MADLSRVDLNSELQKRYEEAKTYIEIDIRDYHGFIGKNLYTAISNNNGNIDMEKLQEAITQSKGHKNENKGYSVESLILSTDEKIKDLIKSGIPEENFNELREKIASFKDDMYKKLETKEGVTSLVNDFIKDKGIVNNIGLVGENNSLVVDKINIVSQISKNFQVPESVTKAGFKNIDILKPIHVELNKYMAKNFAVNGEENNPNWCVLDRTKLTPENINNFTKSVNNLLQAFSVVQENLDPNITVEENQKIASKLLPVISELSPDEVKNIVNNFAPLLESEKLSINLQQFLNKVDSTYLTENSSKIATELKEVNDKGISWWEKFKQVFNGKDYLGQRLEKVVNEYIIKSDEYVVKTVNDKIFSNALTNHEVAEGLTKFLNENKDKVATNPEFKNLIPVTGEPIVVKTEQVNNFNLAELRKIAPRAFDKNIFEDLRDTNIKPPQNTPNPPTQNQTRNRG